MTIRIPVKGEIVVRKMRGHDPKADYHQPVFLGETRVLDSLGRRNVQGCTCIWFVLLCNNPDCRAETLIRESELSALLASGPVHGDET